MLYERMMEDCYIMELTQVSDGAGGRVDTWTPGEVIKAAIVEKSDGETNRADKSIPKDVYTITTYREVVLPFHSVIQRISDGKTFRIVNHGNNFKSPLFSGIDMNNTTAERWELTV